MKLKNIKYISDLNDRDVGDQDDVYPILNIESFKDHSRWPEGYYTCEESEFVVDVPYSAHNRYRQILAEMVGYPPASMPGRYSFIFNYDPQKPFALLFNFADNEGNWDHHTCAKLSDDFRSFSSKVTNLNDKGFIRWYSKLTIHTTIVKSEENSVIVFR